MPIVDAVDLVSYIEGESKDEEKERTRFKEQDGIDIVSGIKGTEQTK